ncbi:MAG: hypothetical protein ACRCYO_15075 [Bacteroidia bacterium]
MAGLLGKWNWVYSDIRIIQYGHQTQIYLAYRRWPEAGENYQLELRSNGKVYLTENGKTERGRMEISDRSNSGSIAANIEGRGLSKIFIRLVLDHPDTLRVYEFPYSDWEKYIPTNYFVRER